jgi:hypothetical protein
VCIRLGISHIHNCLNLGLYSEYHIDHINISQGYHN